MTIKYTKDHEWVLVDGHIATVGITEYAQEQLGDVVFVDLPDVDARFDLGDDVCVVESVKAASDIYAPISGEITQSNHSLEDNPALLNTSPMGEGWIFKMKILNPSELDDLLSQDAYNASIA